MSNIEKLNGKTVLITGATFGIGEQTARYMSKSGAKLILVARTREKLELLQNELVIEGAVVEIFSADLYDLAKTDELMIFLQSFDIDIFVNNAGKSICRPIVESFDRMHDFTRTIGLNFYTPVKISMGLLSKNRNLRIVNISTMSVLLPPTPFWAAYGSSKGAFDHWLRSVGGELYDRLSVGNIYFPLVKTRMIEPTEACKNAKAMTVESAAAIVVMMSASRKRCWKPWWSGVACIFARTFRGFYERQSMRIIKNGKFF